MKHLVIPFLEEPDTSSHGFTLGLCNSLHAKQECPAFHEYRPISLGLALAPLDLPDGCWRAAEPTRPAPIPRVVPSPRPEAPAGALGSLVM